MRSLVVDIADVQVSSDPEVTLITYALGSCIAVALHDPVRRVGGMIHYMLPLSTASPDRAREKPPMFGDTGVPILFEKMYALGCRKSDLVVFVAGGAHIQDSERIFNIGKRNYTLLRKLFWKNNIMIAAEDVGGALSRTFSLEIATGRVLVRSQGTERPLTAATAAPIRVQDAVQGEET